MSSSPQTLTPSQLDALLVPTFLSGLSQSQQSSLVQGNSANAQTFRLQSQQLLRAAKKSFEARKRGTCYFHFTVPWNLPGGPLTVNWCSMADYYCHLLGAPVAGFPFVFSKAFEFQRQQNRIANLKRQGKYCC